MSYLGPRQKCSILQHLDALERLISHVVEHGRLVEEQEQRRKEARRRRKKKKKCVGKALDPALAPAGAI